MANRRVPIVVRVRESFDRLGERIARFGAALVWPIERTFDFFGRKLLAMSERGEQFESIVGAVLRLVSWPFRAVWHGVEAAGRVLVPQSVRRFLALPLRGWMWLQGRVIGALAWLVEVLNLDGVALWLAWLLKPVWYPLAAVGNFLLVWLATRQYKQLLWGLPALVLLMPILAAAAWGALWGKGSVATQYRLAVKDALEEKDYPRVQLYERKLSQLGVDTRLSDFNTAQTLARDGKLDEAYERMQLLAPAEEPGYPPAHFWIVQHLLTGELEVPEEESQRLVGVHLDQLERLGIKGPEIELVRAYWTAQRGALVEAAELLKPLVLRNSMAAIERLRIDLALGRQEDAKADARAVRDHMQSRVRQGLGLSGNEYRWWTVAEELLGNDARIRAVLTAWLKQDPTNQGARRDLAAISLREFNSILSMHDPDPKELAARVREAFELSDASSEMKQQLVEMYLRRHTRPALQSGLDSLVASPDLPASLAEALGTAAALGGEWKHAQVCLERAIALEPDNAVAWNNLACVLSQQPEPQLEPALAAVTKSLELVPDEFRFRETRGQIYLKLGRWREAIDDLEFALNGMPNVGAIHESLAEAYEALGEKQLAEVHRQAAN